jgi:hypothetical protein
MIETKQLLDRIELLFPCKENIRFRRAVLDHDFEAIRYILEELNQFKPWSSFLHNLIKKVRDYPGIEGCLHKSQIQSKHWLLQEIKNILDEPDTQYIRTVFIYGGWYGVLAGILFSHLNVDRIRNFDLDPECYELARKMNVEQTKTWAFTHATLDVNNIEYYHNKEDDKWITEIEYFNDKGEGSKLEEQPDIIINTSAEHMVPKWYDNLPKNFLTVIQSNNYDDLDEHIFCVKDLTDMKDKYPMSEILYEGELDQLGNPVQGIPKPYKRFMLIGRK